jgi:UDP-glucose 4-epimerase
MARYIVTGGAGFIGSHLVRTLLKLGHEVIVVDDLSSGFESYLPDNVPLIIADIADPLFGSRYDYALKDSDGVFHLAARARIQPSILNPERTHKSNVDGTFQVLEMMRRLDIPKIVYSASSSYYGRNPIPCREDQPSDCLNPYSLTKFVGEKYCETWGKIYGTENVRLRYFNVYGERSPTEGAYATVISLFFRQVLRDKAPLTIVGDGEQKRDFTYVGDVVNANLCAMHSTGLSGMVFNVGTETNYTVNQVAKFILDAIEKRGVKTYGTVNIPERPGETRETLASIDLAREKLGWKPAVSFPEMIDSLADYYIKEFNV